MAIETTRKLFEQLVAEGRLRITRSAVFDETPSGRPVPPDRVRGMLFGLAIGDALGNTSESLLPAVRQARHGEIRDYLPNRYADGPHVGLPSDDTQLAFWTLEQILEDGSLGPDALAKRFAERRIFGRGQTVGEFVHRYRAGQPWYEAAPASAGNGALMRIAPVLMPHLRAPSADLWSDTALAAAVTHNDPGSIAACVAYIAILWQLVSIDGVPQAGWWVDAYVNAAAPIEGETRYRPRGGRFMDYDGPIWRFVQDYVPAALREGRSVREAGDDWYSGAYLLETVPTVLHILGRHGHDPEEAIVRAVNDTKDNDTIATIVGAAVGALHGAVALPKRWITGLLGRTREDDDGRVHELVARAGAML